MDDGKVRILITFGTRAVLDGSMNLVFIVNKAWVALFDISGNEQDDSNDRAS